LLEEEEKLITLRGGYMATRVVTSHEMQKQLPELLLLISKGDDKGDDIIIKKDNKPFAKLTAIPKFGKKRIAGLNKGEIWTSEDFDKPLSNAFWLGEK
jgi:antitoxin (DNA-binding transcriptional repressor) of toxin-antitoxin stability system